MNNRYLNRLFLILAGLTVSTTVWAEIRLPNLFSNHMVLQRECPIEIWGWADRGESVQILFDGQKFKTKTDADGCWSVTLPPQNAGGPYTLTVKGKEGTITLTDILIGDVWICGGQSNMEWNVASSINADKEIADADHPNIRFFTVPHNARGIPAEEIDSRWVVCSPETVPNFSAVGYFFGRNLSQQTNVPIGLINSSWGGTRIESWMSPSTFRNLFTDERTFYTQRNHDTSFPAPDLDRLYRDNVESIARFQTAVQKEDPGVAQKWYENSHDISSWQDVTLPSMWSKTPWLKDVDGHLWLKASIELPQGVEQLSATLCLGQIDDRDMVWINGIRIGDTHGYAIERRYTIPYNLLRKGNNTITLRITDTGGDGGIKPNTSLYLEAGREKYPLEGIWKGKLSLTSKDFYQRTLSPNEYPSMLYLGMIAPLTRSKIKGVIWYQGESNAAQALTYRKLFPALIRDWRADWGYEFPFYWVQLANFMAADSLPVQSQWAELREAQTMTLALPRTGQAVTIDIGNPLDIHPRNKQEVGRRLALIALHHDYGRSDSVYSGPIFRSMQVVGDRVILTFDSVESGLVAKQKYGYLQGFSIAGADRLFVWAKARIDGEDKVIVWSDRVAVPVAVRYNWGNNPDGTLYNAEGLPAVPFRTDEWKGITR